MGNSIMRLFSRHTEIKSKDVTIRLEDLPKSGLRTKRYSELFKQKGLGGFEKIKVAQQVKNMLVKSVTEEKQEGLQNTISYFKELFEKIREKFEKQGINL